MRLPLIPAIVIIAINLLIDWYIYKACRKRLKNQKWTKLHIAFSAFMTIVVIVAVSLPRRSGSYDMLLTDMWLLFSYFSVWVSKSIFLVIDLLARLPQLIGLKRIKWLTATGTAVAVTTFIAVWWGALINRFNYQINEVAVEVENLPDAFDGYRVVQISDFHVGTYGADTTYVKKIVDAINSTRTDLAVFTGDIVNRESNELEPFISTLSQTTAPDGVIAILGNHDYGDYCHWKSEADKQRDHSRLINNINRIGWKLLLNETEMIYRGGDSIAVIGVENIGDPPFTVYGDLDKAYANTADSVTKILLSHNPAHWVDDIKDNPKRNIALTLSGHTHAMQISAWGASPAKLRYDTWGGLYSNDDGKRRLYVNIGIGTVGLPMRVGATPELTVITLRKTE